MILVNILENVSSPNKLLLGQLLFRYVSKFAKWMKHTIRAVHIINYLWWIGLPKTQSFRTTYTFLSTIALRFSVLAIAIILSLGNWFRWFCVIVREIQYSRVKLFSLSQPIVHRVRDLWRTRTLFLLEDCYIVGRSSRAGNIPVERPVIACRSYCWLEVSGWLTPMMTKPKAVHV